MEPQKQGSPIQTSLDVSHVSFQRDSQQLEPLIFDCSEVLEIVMKPIRATGFPPQALGAIKAICGGPLCLEGVTVSIGLPEELIHIARANPERFSRLGNQIGEAHLVGLCSAFEACFGRAYLSGVGHEESSSEERESHFTIAAAEQSDSEKGIRYFGGLIILDDEDEEFVDLSAARPEYVDESNEPGPLLGDADEIEARARGNLQKWISCSKETFALFSRFIEVSRVLGGIPSEESIDLFMAVEKLSLGEIAEFKKILANSIEIVINRIISHWRDTYLVIESDTAFGGYSVESKVPPDKSDPLADAYNKLVRDAFIQLVTLYSAYAYTKFKAF